MPASQKWSGGVSAYLPPLLRSRPIIPPHHVPGGVYPIPPSRGRKLRDKGGLPGGRMCAVLRRSKMERRWALGRDLRGGGVCGRPPLPVADRAEHTPLLCIFTDLLSQGSSYMNGHSRPVDTCVRNAIYPVRQRIVSRCNVNRNFVTTIPGLVCVVLWQICGWGNRSTLPCPLLLIPDRTDHTPPSRIRVDSGEQPDFHQIIDHEEDERIPPDY